MGSTNNEKLNTMNPKKPNILSINDNVYTKSFTPKEYQVELLDLAREHDLIVCLASRTAQNFLSLQIVNSFSTQCDRQGIAVCIIDDQSCAKQLAQDIEDFTALSVQYITDNDADFKATQVIVTTSSVLLYLFSNNKLSINCTKLILIDQCHKVLNPNSDLHKVSKYIKNRNQLPRLIGLTNSFLDNATKNKTCEIEAQINQLEQLLGCRTETASDVLTILRYYPKPHEILLESSTEKIECDLVTEIINEINKAEEFLLEHKFDLADVYGDFIDDVEDIADPSSQPLSILNDLKRVLYSLGAWCADRAALILLVKIEQLKVKTKYERHYLLLSMISTLLIKIRCICDDKFKQFEDYECIKRYSSHKLLRLLEILRQFQDNSPAKHLKDEKTNDDIKNIESPTIENLTPDSETGKNIIQVDTNNKVEDKVTTDSEVSETKVNIDDNKSKETEKTETSQELQVIKTINMVRPYRRYQHRSPRKHRRIMNLHLNHSGDMEPLCGLIFVSRRFIAQIVYHLLNAARHCIPELSYISPLYTTSFEEDKESTDLEKEHRKQEEVLKKFRLRECNILVCNSILEEGVELPRCNLVIRFDPPTNFKSMVQSRGRARMNNAYYITLVEDKDSSEYIQMWAENLSLEKLLMSRCHNIEPSDNEEKEADGVCLAIEPFNPSEEEGGASVSLCGAITLVNRYCAKLPSDTFTRLTPLWKFESHDNLIRCFVRLPINSPLKQEIYGAYTKSKSLARRLTALEVCKALYKIKELDKNLQPVGKESFLAQQQDNLGLLDDDEWEDEDGGDKNLEHRPGTTKRRQYYYKKIADSLMECRPEPSQQAFLYHIKLALTCPLPEEQNTRGRKIYPPEESLRSFGILTLKQIPKICSFPIFTRSGEVSVSLELSPHKVSLTSEQCEKVVAFLNYTFSSVLRLQKHLMIFGPESAENSYYIVPVKNGTMVDWDFVDLIWQEKECIPKSVTEEDRKKFKFDCSKYQDAVVMPWYRNQDQPQFFYVAEICTHLTPKSEFPGGEYHTFEEYYKEKYGLKIQCLNQPLLDVDHTSARLNFLTPRYVNRKGVALPVSSEHTKRNKRENLEQKQILIAELCALHPFPASLWRQAVSLPCILYRINGLLLADELRRLVALEVGLGLQNLPEEFQWPQLDFGWSLAEVLQRSRETGIINGTVDPITDDTTNKKKLKEITNGEETEEEDGEEKDKNVTESKSWLEIGTWSNEMAEITDDGESCTDEMLEDLPMNVTMLSGDNYNDGPASEDWGTGIKTASNIRYGSPTFQIRRNMWDMADSCSSFSDDEDNLSMMSEECDYITEKDIAHPDGIRIEFKGDRVAEAFEDEPTFTLPEDILVEPKEPFYWDWQDFGPEWSNIKENYEKQVVKHYKYIQDSGMLINLDKKLEIERNSNTNNNPNNNLHRHSIQDSDKEIASNLFKNLVPDIDNSSNNDSYKQIDNFRHFDEVSSTSDFTEDSESTVSTSFSFDLQPNLKRHPGPSPSIILQGLTMSNANDGINLERLETIGDSFLKYAITTYLFCIHENVHEGKLSHLRSKQVSNLQLYRLGRDKQLGKSMIATKFEPHDNWLPPCYFVPWKLEKALIKAGVPPGMWNRQELASLRLMDNDTIDKLVWERKNEMQNSPLELEENSEHLLPFVPYNLLTQHSIPDKSLADCVEALIGAYLIACGPRGALIFMSWLGIKVVPDVKTVFDGEWLPFPPSPMLHHISNPDDELNRLLRGFDKFELTLNYRFRDRAYLLQAMSHASFSPNRLTDCYQRLEFLGDAVLDYLITRYLYEDKRQHSPGALTDLRSALVNNAIFAVLAVRHGFHKYFLHLSPGLTQVIQRFVKLQQANNHCLSPQYYVLGEGDRSEAEDIEVPKALGDVFESVAGAIFLDSGMSLDAVWKTYHAMMAPELELFSAHVPKSPIRELLEREPETAKFGKPEKLADGRRVRVSVEVFGQGTFRGIGRNYRIAKSTAAKCALRHLSKRSNCPDMRRIY